MRKPSTNAELTLLIQDDDHIAGPDTAAVTARASGSSEVSVPFVMNTEQEIEQTLLELRE